MCLLVYGFAALPRSASGADAGSLADAEKNIAERFAQVRSCSASVMTIETAEPAEGSSIKVEIRRRIEWIRKGGGFLYRAETTSRTLRKDRGAETTDESKATTVSDGADVVTIAERQGRTSATKRKADVTSTPDVAAMLNELRKDQKLSRLPDIKVGEDECYAIRVIPKERKGSDISQTVIYFRKDIGIDVYTIVYDKNNKPIYTSTTTDIRVNQDITPDRFLVVLPDGVELVDQTGRP